jgi:hypothetical protein
MPILVSKNIQKLSAILLMLVSIQKEKAFKLDLQPDEIKKFERRLKRCGEPYSDQSLLAIFYRLIHDQITDEDIETLKELSGKTDKSN